MSPTAVAMSPDSESTQRRCHDYFSDREFLCDPSGPNICQPCKGILEISEKVKSIKLMLAELQNERLQLKAQANQHHDRLTQHLPPEIVAEIFVSCAPESLMDINTHDILSRYTICTPLVVSAVCRKWRDIAFSTPQLLKTLPIYCRATTSELLPMPDPILVKEWIERAGTLPLSILLRIHSLSIKEGIKIIKLLNQYSTRWSELNFRGPISLLSHFPGGTQDLPKLRMLHLENFRNCSIGALGIHPKQLKMLWLTSIMLSTIESQNFDWTHLTQLTVEEVETGTVDKLVEALRRIPNLTKCTFRRICVRNMHQPDFLPDSFVHRKLEELEISHSLYCHAFHRILCPSLKVLILDTGYRSDINFPLVFEFLQKSECLLERLAFVHGASLSESEVISMCNQLPTLQHLSMKLNGKKNQPSAVLVALCGVLSQFLTDDEKTQPMYLPFLRSLSLEQEEAHTSWRMIPDIFGFYTVTRPGCPEEHLYHRRSLESMTIAIGPREKNVAWTLVDDIDEDTLKKITWLKEAGANLMLQVGRAKDDFVELALNRLGISLE